LPFLSGEDGSMAYYEERKVQHASGYQSVLLQEYLEESEDLINEIEETILDLEKNGNQDHLMDCLMRTLHSFKGSAQLMGLDPIVSIAHAMETLVSRSKQSGDDVDPLLVDVCLQCIDALRNLSNELSVSGACSQDVSPILQKIDESVLM
jgi:two-component system chemotaxis sensor kinase CheA